MSGLLVTIGKRGSFGYIAQEGEIEQIGRAHV